ncbi:CHAD domain-containing protein [Paracoccus marinaquae]|uniref:CHAD domain-containing protein n=1 Tax=Paracoccus marinaquae TaxID=2841926 RepID=A0ABS6APC2_9RHOB|nr:CHAD domain-containing protein [Paracoccus marinaquae]MBU3031465.1 CHAD domain-containing protein [Paracoccus marinaquae]
MSAKSKQKHTDDALTPGMSAEEAFRLALRRGAATYEARRAAILSEDGTPEDVHAARVALRRMRSVLRGFSDMLTEKAERRLQRNLAERFRFLGPLRDADVQAEALTGDPGKEAAAKAAELRAGVRAELAKSDEPALPGQIEALLADDERLIRGDRCRRLAAAPVAVLASRALQVAWTELLAFGDDPTALPAVDLHEFRKRAKDFRYLSETFGPLCPGKAASASLKQLKVLQDSLGTLNDLHVMAGGEDSGPLPHDAEEREAVARTSATDAWRKLRKAPLWWAASDC